MVQITADVVATTAVLQSGGRDRRIITGVKPAWAVHSELISRDRGHREGRMGLVNLSQNPFRRRMFLAPL